MNENDAKNLIENYNEALDHLWLGNGQPLDYREKVYAEAYDKLLQALMKIPQGESYA